LGASRFSEEGQIRETVKMLGVKIEVNRFVEDGQPAIVECVLVDGYGKEHIFIEKVPIVTTKDLDASSLYPQAGIIACQIVECKRVGDGALIRIETESPWHIQSIAGQSCFDVLPEQLIELNS
jgi:hypothetical protein